MTQHGPPAYPVWQPRPKMSLLRAWGIAGLIAGPILAVLGAIIAVLPLGLFILGGGGNTEAFDDFARGFYATGGVMIVVGIALVIFGIVGVVAGRRPRPRY